jgi:hypothetical protein
MNWEVLDTMGVCRWIVPLRMVQKPIDGMVPRTDRLDTEETGGCEANARPMGLAVPVI